MLAILSLDLSPSLHGYSLVAFSWATLLVDNCLTLFDACLLFDKVRIIMTGCFNSMTNISSKKTVRRKRNLILFHEEVALFKSTNQYNIILVNTTGRISGQRSNWCKRDLGRWDHRSSCHVQILLKFRLTKTRNKAHDFLKMGTEMGDRREEGRGENSVKRQYSFSARTAKKKALQVQIYLTRSLYLLCEYDLFAN